jgi:hypothetical protein
MAATTTETSQEREWRIQEMSEHGARNLAGDVGNAAFDILENIAGPDEWLSDHSTDVTITLSAADWARVFTALQFTSVKEGESGFGKGALDNAYLAMEIAAELAAAKRPLEAPAA